MTVQRRLKRHDFRALAATTDGAKALDSCFESQMASTRCRLGITPTATTLSKSQQARPALHLAAEISNDTVDEVAKVLDNVNVFGVLGDACNSPAIRRGALRVTLSFAATFYTRASSIVRPSFFHIASTCAVLIQEIGQQFKDNLLMGEAQALKWFERRLSDLPDAWLATLPSLANLQIQSVIIDHNSSQRDYEDYTDDEDIARIVSAYRRLQKLLGHEESPDKSFDRVELALMAPMLISAPHSDASMRYARLPAQQKIVSQGGSSVSTFANALKDSDETSTGEVHRTLTPAASVDEQSEGMDMFEIARTAHGTLPRSVAQLMD